MGKEDGKKKQREDREGKSKKVGEGKWKEKQNEAVLDGESTPNEETKEKKEPQKIDRKGKGKAAKGVEYEKTANGYRAKAKTNGIKLRDVNEDADLQAWEDLWSQN